MHEDVPTLQTVEVAQPVPTIPGGELRAPSSASLVPAERVAAAAAMADYEAGEALCETASYAPGDKGVQNFGRPGGDGEAAGLVNVSAALPEGGNVGGRGYMGKRFIQAAEVRYVVQDETIECVQHRRPTLCSS